MKRKDSCWLPAVIGMLLSAGVCLLLARPLAAEDAWQKVQAFGVELEVPARWKRFEFRMPRSDHDEIQFAENARNPTAGAWFSIFPKADDVVDLSRPEKSVDFAGKPALVTDFLSRAEDPPPRRRQVVVYFEDKNAPAFLFDGDADKWSRLGPILTRIHASIRLPSK